MDAGENEQHDLQDSREGNPAIDAARLSEAVTGLTKQTTDESMRAQLHVLAGIIENLRFETGELEGRKELEGEVVSAISAGDETAFLQASRRLTRFDRERITPLNWSEGSGA